MIPNMPALGIRFDIGKIESGAYGLECWKIFWRAVKIEILSGSLLFEGDTAATLNGKEYVYCIAVQSNNPMFDEIQHALDRSIEYKRIAASPRFIEGSQVVREPLPEAGKVDSGGNLVGKAYNSLPALGAVLRERQQLPQADQPSIAIPERKKPGSSRTASLPPVSSLKELLGFLLANFGEKNEWQFWVTPEELCDIVEQYADILQIQWAEGSCGISVDMAYVTLFNKGKAGENIALHGLFPFTTEEAAKRFCYDPSANLDYLFGQLEGLYGIQGKFGINFSGGNHSNWISDDSYRKENDIDAFDLWPRIWRRCVALGISLSSDPN